MLPFLLCRLDVDRAALDAAFAATKLSAPSVAAALLKDGKTVWTGLKGAKTDDEYRIGSLTKAFTATVVLQLVREGKLALDDPAAKFVPDLPKAWDGATVRRLLNHTSGIPSYTDQPDFVARIGERLTPAQIVARTADKPLDFPIGSRFSYDNTGYVILGEIVERLDRRPFADSLRRRILDPLGLKHTRLNVDGAKAVALGFGSDGKPAIGINMSQPYAAGSMVSTIGDMAKWVAAQGSPRLLPPALWDEMGKSGALTGGKSIGYGFGWFVGAMNGVPTLNHSGGIPGFTTYVSRAPSKGLASIVLTNAEGVNPALLAKRLLETADPTLREPDVAVADPDPKATALVERHLRELAKGEVDRSYLQPAMSEKLTPELVEQVKGLLERFGSLKSMRLIKIEGRTRTYRAEFDNETVRIIATVDESGKLANFGIRPL